MNSLQFGYIVTDQKQNLNTLILLFLHCIPKHLCYIIYHNSCTFITQFNNSDSFYFIAGVIHVLKQCKIRVKNKRAIQNAQLYIKTWQLIIKQSECHMVLTSMKKTKRKLRPSIRVLVDTFYENLDSVISEMPFLTKVKIRHKNFVY